MVRNGQQRLTLKHKGKIAVVNITAKHCSRFPAKGFVKMYKIICVKLMFGLVLNQVFSFIFKGLTFVEKMSPLYFGRASTCV